MLCACCGVECGDLGYHVILRLIVNPINMTVTRPMLEKKYASQLGLLDLCIYIYIYISPQPSSQPSPKLSPQPSQQSSTQL